MNDRTELPLVHATGTAMRWDGVSVVDVTDIVLLSFVRRDAAHMTIEPCEAGYRIVLDDDLESALLIPSALGEGLVARLAILTGLDILALEARMGRLGIRPVAAESAGSEPIEIITVGRHRARGGAIDVRRLASAKRDEIMLDDAEILAIDGVPVVAPRSDAVYEIHRELGRGGMATVYLGTHRILEKPVAIKVLDAEMARNPAVAASLIREGRTASRIRHPGVVGVTDFGTLHDGRAYLVMEYIESGTLSAALKAGPFSPLRALGVAREVADALEAVREADVVHGDIKPSNIFLLPGDRIKLVDFGAAHIGGAPSMKEKDLFIGTPAYLAPECVLGKPADHRVDQYALGCVLFRMVVGVTPFKGATTSETLRAHVRAPIPKVSADPGALASPLDSILSRALAKNPDDRYPTAGVMRDDIQRAIQFLSARGGG